jgi:phosphoribosylanthranilate isomerase
VTPVGLFVNAPRAEIEAALAAVPALVLQFHGDETPEQCASFGRPYLRAVRMSPQVDLLDFARRFGEAQGLLLDAHVEGFGGGGKAFDWSLVPAGFSAQARRRLVLSGGLHAGNVCAGILQLRPWAVDVSSGVESSRGVKDAAAIRRFCDAVREADARIAAS